MKKSYFCLLTVAIVIASIVITGCTTSNQANQASSSETSTNTSTSSTTSTAAVATSSAASASPTVTPSPSASPTAATPTPSGKSATSIQFASDPSVKKGELIGIKVISSTTGTWICTTGAVTVVGQDGTAIGTVLSRGTSGCYPTAALDTSSLNPGKYDVTLKFAGDSANNPSQSTSKITVTA